ncbi:MAG: hypothetical protein IPL96_10340 [Holophagaceae bacterium]|nr:hypothetical protein [Holophagaceae bacterium]
MMITDALISRLLIGFIGAVLLMVLLGKWRKSLPTMPVNLLLGWAFAIRALYHLAQWIFGTPEGSRFLGPQGFGSGTDAIFWGYMAILQFSNRFLSFKDRVLWGRASDPSWIEIGALCLAGAAFCGYLLIAEPGMDRQIRLSFEILGTLCMVISAGFFARAVMERFKKRKTA